MAMASSSEAMQDEWSRCSSGEGGATRNRIGSQAWEHSRPKKKRKTLCNTKSICSTEGPLLNMRILGLVKSRIRGKSHNDNQKVVIPSVHDFSLMCEIKITFAADHTKYDKKFSYSD